MNQATGVAHRSVRGEGAFRDGVRMTASRTERVEDSVVALSGLPGMILPWKQFRVLGSAALALCDVAAGAAAAPGPCAVGMAMPGAWPNRVLVSRPGPVPTTSPVVRSMTRSRTKSCSADLVPSCAAD